MTVFIVTRGEYSDYHIEAVFSNREDAIKYCALHNDDYEPCEIEEYEMDEYSYDGNVKVGYEYEYYASLIHGNYEERWDWDSEKPSYTVLSDKRVRVKKEENSFGPAFSIFVILDERNDEKAVKIARDRLAMINAANKLID